MDDSDRRGRYSESLHSEVSAAGFLCHVRPSCPRNTMYHLVPVLGRPFLERVVLFLI